MIAGFFANYLYQKRGVKGFLKHRLKRIGLPFVIFLPLIVIAFNVLIIFIVLYVPIQKLPPSLQQAVPMIRSTLGIESGQSPQTINNSSDNADTAGADEIKIQTPVDSDNPNVSQEVSEPIPDDTSKNVDVTRAAKTDPQITQHLWFLYYLLLFCFCALQNELIYSCTGNNNVYYQSDYIPWRTHDNSINKNQMPYNE